MFVVIFRRRLVIGVLVVAFLFTLSPLGNRTPLFAEANVWGIEEIAPLPNSHSATGVQTPYIRFDTEIDSASVNEHTFVVRGSLSGQIPGRYVVDKGVISFASTPGAEFRENETVYITLTNGIMNKAGQHLAKPLTWEYRVGAAGDENFERGPVLEAGIVWALAVGDFDEDGRNDLFAGTQSGDQIWLYDDAADTFLKTTQVLGPAEWQTMSAAVGDLDLDGDIDVLAVKSSGQVPVPAALYFNDGTGNFSSSSGLNTGTTPYSVALGDLDGDGDMDAFLGTAFGGQVWLNQGGAQSGTPGTFLKNGNALGNGDMRSVALGDLDGDYDLDAFAAIAEYQGHQVWLNDGSGNFSDSGARIGSDFGQTVSLGDLDNDGDLDAFVGNSFNVSPDRVYLNDGGGGFTAIAQALGAGNTSDSEIADFNADGYLDLYTTESGGTVWLNRLSTDHYFEQVRAFSNAPADVLVVADLIGSSSMDVLIEKGNLEVWVGFAPGPGCVCSAEQFCMLECMELCGVAVGAPALRPTDTIDLDVFYGVRDQIMATTPQGQHYIQLYYAHNTEVLQLLLANAALWNQAGALIMQWQPNLAALLQGNGDAVTITSAQVQALDAFLDALSDAGSAELKQTIADERVSLGPLDNFIGMNMTQARAQIIGYSAYLPRVTKSADKHSTIAVTNLSDTTINAMLELFDVNGRVVHTANQNISAHGAANFRLPDSLGNNFNGAARVSSSDALTALVQNANANQHARNALQPVPVPLTTLTLPLLRHRGSENAKSIFTIQNTSEISPTQVTLHYFNADGSRAGTDTQNIAPRGSYAFDTFALFGANNVTYSARVESETYVAGALEIFTPRDSAALRALGDADTGTALLIPFVERATKNGEPNNWSEIFVQNRGMTETQATLAFFSPQGAKIAQQSKPLAGNGFVAFDTRKLKKLGDKFSGYAILSQNGSASLAVTALETNVKGKRVFAFAGMPLARAASNWVCADLRRVGVPKQATRFKIVNPSASGAGIAVDLYSADTGVLVMTKTFSVAAYRQVTVHLGKAMFASVGENFNGTARVRSTSGPDVFVTSYATYAGGGTTGNTCEPAR